MFEKFLFLIRLDFTLPEIHTLLPERAPHFTDAYSNTDYLSLVRSARTLTHVWRATFYDNWLRSVLDCFNTKAVPLCLTLLSTVDTLVRNLLLHMLRSDHLNAVSYIIYARPVTE